MDLEPTWDSLIPRNPFQMVYLESDDIIKESREELMSMLCFLYITSATDIKMTQITSTYLKT